MLKNTSAALGSALLFFVAVPSITMVSASQWWLAEALTSVSLHLGLVALVTLPFLGFGGSRWRSLLAAVIAVAHLAPIAVLSYGVGPPTTRGDEIRVALVNVLSSNRDADALAEWVADEEPAVLAVLELQSFWHRRFAESDLVGRYPHRHEAVRAGDAGVALYSRYPILEASTIQVGRSGIPMIDATVELDGCAVRLFILNGFAPISRATWASREELLARAGDRQRSGEAPRVVLAGLNATLHSSAYRRFLRDNELIDTRAGVGRQPTWMPSFGPLGLDIDHVFVSEELGVRSRRVGRSIGSDHAPIVADLIIDRSRCLERTASEGSGGSETGSD